MTRERKVKKFPVSASYTNKEGNVISLSAEQRAENRKKNVTVYAAKRVDKAVERIDILGNCIGSEYDWCKCTNDPTVEQIDEIKKTLDAAVDRCIDSLRTGQKIVKAGIAL